MFNKKKFINKLVILLYLLIISTLLLGMDNPNKSSNKKIFRNIHIQQIDVGNMTKEEARELINKNCKVKPIDIKYGKKSWSINPNDIDLEYNVEKSLNNAFKYTRTNDKLQNINRIFKLTFKKDHKIILEATYNEVKLSHIIEAICKEINVKVCQASIEVKDSGEIVRKPSKEGIEVNTIELKERIYDMISDKKIKDIELPINIIKPTITTQDVESINTILGQYSTSFNNYSSRGSNIYVAGESTSNRLIMPQETFSYNKSTGARTWSNGYKTAKVIVGGKYVNGEGGGVCQVSTTIYNAALISGLEIEEVHNHTFPSRYAPRGRDAAVSYGYTDLKFKNPYSHPIYIKNIVKNGAITSKIYGCSQDQEKVYIKTEENYDKEKIIVKTYRIYLDEENNKIREELIAESKYKLK